MRIHPKIHEAIEKRAHEKGMVPIECECGVHLAWAKWRGNVVICPSCGRTETLPIADVPTAAVEPDGMNVKPHELPPLPAPEKPADVE